MPKSNGGLPFGRGSGAVTIIEQPVMRSYIRKAKIAFFIIWAAVALLAATVLVSKWDAEVRRDRRRDPLPDHRRPDRPGPGVPHRRPGGSVAGAAGHLVVAA